MPYAVELALDPTSAGVVRRLWRELDAAGITYVARAGARPHVTLGIWDALEHEDAVAELRRFAAATAPVTLRLASVGLFPGVAVFLAPTVTPELLDLHARFHHRFGLLGRAPWPDQFASALSIAARTPLPLESRLVEVGIVEFRPVRQLVSCALGGR